MVQLYSIAVDLMSGDAGLEPALTSALSFIETNPDVFLFLVGDKEKILPLLACTKYSDSSKAYRFEVVHAPQTVEMGDKPSHALRRKQNSSMAVALALVRDGKAGGCVSAGNTGALVAYSRYLLDTLPGIDRPAIIKKIPISKKDVYLLDLGANVDCKAAQLVQFAIMGSLVARTEQDVSLPKVALLNIGTEDIKGNEQVRLASMTLKESSEVEYIGFIEGDKLFAGEADVVVCDGFVGNVALKVSEGVLSLTLDLIKKNLASTIYGKFITMLALPLIRRIRRQLEPAYFNGAELVGLNGVVIKSHGNADALAFTQALDQAVIGIKKDVPLALRQHLHLWDVSL